MGIRGVRDDCRGVKYDVGVKGWHPYIEYLPRRCL